MPLIKDGQLIRDDPWVEIDSDAPLPVLGPVVIGLQRLIDEMPSLRPLGIRIPNNIDVEKLVDKFENIDLIVLEFPTCRDGRAYSQARCLRQFCQFKGEIRATGHIIKDQFLFLHRCGFNAVVTDERSEAQDWNKALQEIPHAYQDATDAQASIRQLRLQRLKN